MNVRRAIKDALVRSPVPLPAPLVRGALRSYESYLSARAGREEAPADGLPVPPAALRVLVSGTADREFFLHSGKVETDLIREVLARHGTPVEELGSLLDFGCGCGRLARWWAGLEHTAVHGCDYNPRLVGWCQENLRFMRAARNELAPPLPYEDGTFDFVYALSVFTHLPVDLAERWLEELRRVIRPGGLLMFSAHGERYLSRLSEDERETYARGQVVTQFEQVAGTNLCAVYHPPAYVTDTMLSGFDVLEAVPAPPEDPAGEYVLPHDMYLARTPDEPRGGGGGSSGPAPRDEARTRLAMPERLRWLLGFGTWEKWALVLVVAAALSPAATPTAVGLITPGAYHSLWSVRPAAGLNLVELGLVLLGAAFLPRLLAGRIPRSSLDRHFAVFGAVVVVVQLLALERGSGELTYQLLDVERVVLVFGGYLVVSRIAMSSDQLRGVIFLVAGVLLATFAWFTLRYGIVGSTNFGTAGGRIALLITEDSLLVGFAVVLAWGMLVDGLLRGQQRLAAVALLLTTIAVELLSVRRGALIFIVLAVLVRSLRAPRRLLIGAAASAAVLAALAIVLGPARPLADTARYTVESAVLSTKDASSSQRTAELKNFGRNMAGVSDVVLGRGLGAVWNAEVSSPVDLASFGSDETPYVRVGWHVYGLDWLYKLGALAVAAGLVLLVLAALLVRRRMPDLADPIVRSSARSLALLVPIFLLLAFTNPRIAFFAGVSAGLLSKALDLPDRGRAARAVP